MTASAPTAAATKTKILDENQHRISTYSKGLLKCFCQRATAYINIDFKIICKEQISLFFAENWR